MSLQKGQKSDVVTVLVKLEFGERIIGETAKIDCLADQESEVNYSASLLVSSDDAVLIDELASKPLLCKLTLLSASLPVSLFVSDDQNLYISSILA